MAKCWHCAGDGYGTCSQCNGSGKDDIALPGTEDYADETCERCNGTGRVECFLCNGTGEISD